MNKFYRPFYEIKIMKLKHIKKLFVIFLMIADCSFGAYCSWFGGNSTGPDNWAIANNWACGIVPNSTYTANISTNGSSPVISSNVGTAQGIYMSPYFASDSVELTIDGGTINIAQNIYIATVGSGTANVTVTNGGSLIALGSGYGNLNLNGSGKGNLIIIDGTVEVKSVIISAGHSIVIGNNGNLIIQSDAVNLINDYIQNGLIAAYQGQGSVKVIYENGKTYVNLQGIVQGESYLFADIDGNNQVNIIDLAFLASEWLLTDPGISQTRMPWIDARMYNGGALNNETINKAINGIGGVKRTLLLGAGIWEVNNSLTIPLNINLKFEHGAILNVNATCIVNINGSLDASANQIFSGSGQVKLNPLIQSAYPQWWGTPGSGDDTAICQAALDSGVRNIYFPSAVYNIDADGTGDQSAGLKLPSDVNVAFEEGSKLKVIPNSSTVYSVITITGKNNISLSGACIEGDRNFHTGTTGEWGFGISISNSQNITIKDVNVYDCWGDGIYICSVSDRVTVRDSIFNHNRRNGCSIISAKNVLFENCVFSNSDGTSPYKGVDIEPNYESDILQNIVFNNCRSYNNLAKGFSPAFDGALINPVSITFSNCSSDGDGTGFGIDAGPRNTLGTITFRDCTSTNAVENGFSCIAANINTVIDGLYIVNPGQRNDSRPQFSSGFVVWIDSSRSNLWCGNIHASNVNVQSSDGKAEYALYLNNEASGGTTTFRDIDIQMTTNMINAKRLYKGTGPYADYCTITFTDNPVYNSTASVSSGNMYKYISQRLTNQGASGPVTFNFNSASASSFDSTYLIDNLNGNGIILNFSGYNLMPGNRSTYSSSQQGSYLKIRADGVNYYIIESVGTWQ